MILLVIGTPLLIGIIRYIFLQRPHLLILKDRILIGDKTILFAEISVVDIDAQLSGAWGLKEEMVVI